MHTTRINYKIRIHSLPESLKNLPKESYLQETHRIYQLAIDLKIIWRIWMIDEFGKKWIEIEFENDEGQDEWRSLAIDEGTYRKVSSDEYEIIIE